MTVNLHGRNLELSDCERVQSMKPFVKTDRPPTTVVAWISNSLRARARAAAALVSSTGPVTANSDVKDNLVILERVADVARVAAREAGNGRAPAAWVGLAVCDVFRDSLTGEEPDIDPIRLPGMCVDSTGVFVEIVAVSGVVIHGVVTASIGAVRALACLTDDATSGLDGIFDNIAYIASVSGDLVVSLLIDTLCKRIRSLGLIVWDEFARHSPRISSSPPAGQLGPTVQYAGHVEQP